MKTQHHKHTYPILKGAVLSLIACLFFLIGNAEAKPKYFFKIASLAPEGSVWITQFKNFTQEVSEKSGGEVGFRVYPGGIMGDDQAMYRKMRVGQLHGGGFTMSGISSVVPNFRVMALPFFFRSYEEVDRVSEGLMPIFRKSFNEKGMELIALTEVGFIYTMSTTPRITTQDLQKSKSWSPAGDPIATEYFSSLGVSPISLSIPDVLTALQTGMVNTVYNSLYGSIVLQWFPKAKFITDTPYGYAYGVFALDRKKFSKLPDKYARLIHEAAEKHFSELLLQTRKSNQDSRKVLLDNGVTFVSSSPEVIDELIMYRDQTVEKMVGNYFTHEAYDTATSILKKVRGE